jgi:hypothetical protein
LKNRIAQIASPPLPLLHFDGEGEEEMRKLRSDMWILKKLSPHKEDLYRRHNAKNKK